MEKSELYKVLQNKESKMRKRLNDLFDKYGVVQKERPTIMALSRQISTVKNLKEAQDNTRKPKKVITKK